MWKIFLTFGLAAASTDSLAWDLVHSYWDCNQRCGFNSSTLQEVEANGMDRDTVLLRLAQQCNWRNADFALQGKPSCKEKIVDQSKREDAYRCIEGVGSDCNVAYWLPGNGRTSSMMFTASGSSFDSANERALSTCERNAAEKGLEGYCDLYTYNAWDEFPFFQ